MKYNLPERVIRDISTFAKKHSVEKVILFGSRARGTNTERSDIDIAVYGGDFDSFYWDIKEKVHSLLMFDIVEIDAGISEELRKEIKKDGVVIYEKAWKFFELLKCIEKTLQRKLGWEILQTISLEDNNTDLSSYFRVDKKKVLCYTEFTKWSISNWVISN